MSEELWTEVHNIVQEALTKTIPKKKKCKEAKWLYEEALQITRKEEKWKEGKKIWVKLFNPSRLHLIYSYIMTHYHETWIPHLYIQTSYLVLFLRVICITFTITLWDTIFICNLQLRMEQQTGRGTTDWFQIGKGVHQGCISSPCLFNLYAEYIMRNGGLD